MAASIDIKNSSRIRLTAAGFRAERVAVVSGVSGTAAQVLYNAINDAALPDIGDAHPEEASITLNDISCEPLGGGRYRVVMSYYKDPGVVTDSSSAEGRLVTGLSVEETHEDINGQPMDTSYWLVGSVSIALQRFTAEVERPRMTFHFEYTATGFPTSDILNYLGKINSAIWNGFPIGTILCSAIDTDQNGANFRVKYSFAYRAEGWQFVGKVSYHPDSIAASNDPGLDAATGLRPFNVYRSVDFTALGFVLVSVAYPLVANSGVIRIVGSDATLTVA